MTISTRYIYSACVTSTTPDLTLLQDPWFTQGAYDGSWFHWPAVSDPLSACGNSDYIYVSHIHPDHYDPVFLRKYQQTFGNKQVLVARRRNNYLYTKAVSDGFDVVEVDPDSGLRVRDTWINIIPHYSANSNNIDSALVLQYNDHEGKRHTLVNLNDCIYDPEFYSVVMDSAGPHVDVLLTTYTGAGPYPQCFFSPTDPQLPKLAQEKQDLFLRRYKQTLDFFQPRLALPFAGQYVLGGRLAALNPFRGNCDAIKTTTVSSRSVVLHEGGQNLLSSDGSVLGQRNEPHDLDAMYTYASSISIRDPKDSIGSLSFSAIEPVLIRLLAKAAKNASRAQQTDLDWSYVFTVSAEKSYAVSIRDAGCLTLDADQLTVFKATCDYIQVFLDYNHFFFLLTGVLHWNNAIVGSWLRYERSPDVYYQELQTYLNFLSV